MNSYARKRRGMGRGSITPPSSATRTKLEAQEVPHAPMLPTPPALLTEATAISTPPRGRRWIVSVLGLAVILHIMFLILMFCLFQSLVMDVDARMLTSGINTARSGLNIVIVLGQLLCVMFVFKL